MTTVNEKHFAYITQHDIAKLYNEYSTYFSNKHATANVPHILEQYSKLIPPCAVLKHTSTADNEILWLLVRDDYVIDYLRYGKKEGKLVTDADSDKVTIAYDGSNAAFALVNDNAVPDTTFTVSKMYNLTFSCLLRPKISVQGQALKTYKLRMIISYYLAHGKNVLIGKADIETHEYSGDGSLLKHVKRKVNLTKFNEMRHGK